MMGCEKLDLDEYKRINNQMFNFMENKKRKNEKLADEIVKSIKDDVTRQVKNDIYKEIKKDVIEHVEKNIVQEIKKDIVQEIKTDIKPKNFFKVDNISEFITIVATISVAIVFIVAMSISIDNLKDEVDEISTQVSSMYDDMYLQGGIQGQLQDIREKLQKDENVNAQVLEADEDMVVSLDELSVKDNNISNTTSAFYKDTLIGKKTDGELCYAEKFVDVPVLLSYKVDEKEVYFIGHYNESYQC